jgi:hypothetical protein
MRKSSYGPVGFDEMVMSMIQTGPAISDVMGERDLLGDDEYEGGREGREISVSCRTGAEAYMRSLDAGDWAWPLGLAGATSGTNSDPDPCVSMASTDSDGQHFTAPSSIPVDTAKTGATQLLLIYIDWQLASAPGTAILNTTGNVNFTTGFHYIVGHKPPFQLGYRPFYRFSLPLSGSPKLPCHESAMPQLGIPSPVISNTPTHRSPARCHSSTASTLKVGHEGGASTSSFPRSSPRY